MCSLEISSVVQLLENDNYNKVQNFIFDHLSRRGAFEKEAVSFFANYLKIYKNNRTHEKEMKNELESRIENETESKMGQSAESLLIWLVKLDSKDKFSLKEGMYGISMKTLIADFVFDEYMNDMLEKNKALEFWQRFYDIPRKYNKTDKRNPKCPIDILQYFSVFAYYLLSIELKKTEAEGVRDAIKKRQRVCLLLFLSFTAYIRDIEKTYFAEYAEINYKKGNDEKNNDENKFFISKSNLDLICSKDVRSLTVSGTHNVIKKQLDKMKKNEQPFLKNKFSSYCIALIMRKSWLKNTSLLSTAKRLNSAWEEMIGLANESEGMEEFSDYFYESIGQAYANKVKELYELNDDWRTYLIIRKKLKDEKIGSDTIDRINEFYSNEKYSTDDLKNGKIDCIIDEIKGNTMLLSDIMALAKNSND